MQGLKSVSVLCVVSGQTVAEELKLLLNGAGINQVSVTDSVDDIFDTLSDGSIDVLVVHDNPPEIDGIELSTDVRTSPKSPNITLPVVLVSDDFCIPRTVDAVHAGINETLVFPFNSDKLLQRLTSALDDQREFVKTDKYVGPDRRLLKRREDKQPSRRQEDAIRPQEKRLYDL